MDLTKAKKEITFENQPLVIENLEAGNVKKDVTILGVTGTLESGGTTPQTIGELDAIIKAYYNSLETGTVQPYTQNAITLYTPSANFERYFIRKRSDSEIYNIVWLRETESTPNPVLHDLTNLGYSLDRIGFKSVGQPYLYNRNLDSNTVNTELEPKAIPDRLALYLSSNYNTLVDAIAAIQNTSTTYTRYDSVTGFNADTTYFGYTNLEYFCRDENNEYVEFKRLSPLSNNETIEVIQ